VTNPSDELRTAAARARTLADTATPGPWTVDSSIPYGHRVGSSDEADWVAWTGEHGEDGSETDAAYIAAMGPNVGTALADVFDAWARVGELDPDLLNRVGGPETLAVARAINTGGQP